MIKQVLRILLVAVWIVVAVLLTGWFVGLAANNHLLVWAAPVLPLFPILALYWLKPKEELAGWALFTVWLGLVILFGILFQESCPNY